MNPLNAVILMILGIILGLGILFVIAWIMNQGKRLPPRYIKETQRWLWLMNKHPLKIWNAKTTKIKWTNWDLGKGLIHLKTGTHRGHYPSVGDVIVVTGRYGQNLMLIITDLADEGSVIYLESCYIGYLYA